MTIVRLAVRLPLSLVRAIAGALASTTALGRFLHGDVAEMQFMRLGIMIVMTGINWHGFFDQAFHLSQQGDFFLGAKAYGMSTRSRTRGTTDSVDVGVGLHRQVVVNDQSDVFHINASCCHIGGYQDVDFPAAIAFQCLFAGRLRLVAVDRIGPEAISAHFFGKIFRAVLGAREDQAQFSGVFIVATLQQFQDELLFAALADEAN